MPRTKKNPDATATPESKVRDAVTAFLRKPTADAYNNLLSSARGFQTAYLEAFNVPAETDGDWKPPTLSKNYPDTP